VSGKPSDVLSCGIKELLKIQTEQKNGIKILKSIPKYF
jgi:hypothetical protein